MIQASRPWISSVDVDRGTLWFSEISNVLAEVQVGIVCLTHDNKAKPWILFEVGALAKGLTSSRVCTILCDLDPHDIQDPLAQFNHTKPDQDGMKKLARTLNNVLGANGLDPNVLNDACDTYWPMFEQRYKVAMDSFPREAAVEVRTNDSVLEEILNSVRGMDKRLRQVEAREQYPSWSDARLEYVTGVPGGPPIAETELMNEMLNALRGGASVEQITEFAKRFKLEQAVVDGILRQYKNQPADRNMLMGGAVLRPQKKER